MPLFVEVMSNYLCMPLRKAQLMFDKIDANGDGKVTRGGRRAGRAQDA